VAEGIADKPTYQLRTARLRHRAALLDSRRCRVPTSMRWLGDAGGSSRTLRRTRAARCLTHTERLSRRLLSLFAQGRVGLRGRVAAYAAGFYASEGELVVAVVE